MLLKSVDQYVGLDSLVAKMLNTKSKFVGSISGAHTYFFTQLDERVFNVVHLPQSAGKVTSIKITQNNFAHILKKCSLLKTENKSS